MRVPKIIPLSAGLFAVLWVVTACAEKSDTLTLQEAREGLHAESHALATIGCQIPIGYLVKDEGTARALANVIFDAHESHIERNGMEIEIEDKGWYWSVFETTPIKHFKGPDGRDMQTLTVGGGMAMNIDKCTGAISEIYYQK